MMRQLAGTAVLRREGAGDAPLVVLLHGIGSRGASWQALIAALDPRFPVLAWDAPGYGASAPLTVPPTPAAYAARLAAILDAVAPRPVLLAGHSLGALFAAAFAARWPARVLAVALISPAAGYRVPAGAALPPGVQARIDDLARLGPAAFAAARAPRLLHRPERHPALLAQVRDTMASIAPAGYADAVHALGAGDLLADAPHIAAPTLVAVGAEDAVTPPAGARALFAALSRGLRLVELPDTGHALPQEAPVQLAALLAELASCR